MATEQGRNAQKPLRILYFGMLGQLSARPLAALLAAGQNVVGVILPAGSLPAFQPQSDEPITAVFPTGPDNVIPVINSDSPDMLQLVQRYRLSTYASRSLDHPQTVDLIRQMQPDVICVSCFTQRIPTKILNIPLHGGLNLHPSLLPKYRGPDPLFWTFRAGDLETGVTIHYMDEGLDTGDIAMQVPVPLPDGTTGPEAEQILAAQGGELLAVALVRLAEGRLPRKPQVSGGSYQPAPTPADYSISTDWPARRAYNFMRGTANRKRPYALAIEGQVIFLQTAVFFNESMTLPHPIIWRGKDVLIRMSPGVLRARVAV